MTRINLVSVKMLPDQHLIAEYRELPRVIKQNMNLKDAPEKYCLGKGHMKWGRKHSLFYLKRFKDICEEMTYRGLTVNYPYNELERYYDKNCPDNIKNDYIPTDDDLKLSKERIIQKISLKPNWYRYTKRERVI